LSPKVVTVNSLPMVLPDMIVLRLLSQSSAHLAARRQLLAREQEYPAAAALEVKPQERHAAEGPPHRGLGVAHLHDEQAPGAQMPPRLPQNDPHAIQSRAAGGERHARLVPVLRRQPAQFSAPHVGRIRHDDIVGCPLQRTEVIGLYESHTVSETVTAHVSARALQRALRYVERID